MTQLSSFWNSMADQYNNAPDPDINNQFEFEVGRALPNYMQNLANYDQFQNTYDNGFSRFEYMANDERLAQLELEKDILAEREDPTGRFSQVTKGSGLSDMGIENSLMQDQSGNWIRLRDNLEESIGYSFQNESRKAMSGSTIHGVQRDLQNISLSLDDEVADTVFPITPEVSALIEEYGSLGMAPVEAFLDIFRALSPNHSRKVAFKYDNPALDLIRTPDPDWTEEARKNAWVTLNNSPRYGALMEKVGITEEDVMNSVSGLSLRFQINSRRNAIVTQNVIKEMPLTKDFNTFATWSKRFVVDNFINDPDTAVEVGAAAGMFALGFVTGGSTWVGTAALLGKVGQKGYKATIAIDKVRKSLSFINKASNVTRALPKFLPTQVVSEIVFPVVKGVRGGAKFRTALATATKNPDPVSWTQFLMGAGIEGGVSEFGAYFVNLAELKELNDEVYGEGNHLVDFRFNDLLLSMGMGAVFSGALGAGIRGAAAGVAKVDFFNAAGRLAANKGTGWVAQLKGQRSEMLTDWYLMQWTGKFDRGSLVEDPDFMRVLNDAKSRGWDPATRLREMDEKIVKSRGKLSIEQVRSEVRRDIKRYDSSEAARYSKALESMAGQEGQALVQSERADLTNQDVIHEGKPETDSTTVGGRAEIVEDAVNKAADEEKNIGDPPKGEEATPTPAKTYDGYSVEANEASVNLANLRKQEPKDVKAIEKAEEEYKKILARREELGKEIAEANPTWRIDRMRAIKGDAIGREMDSIRSDGTDRMLGRRTKGVLKNLFRGHTQNPAVRAKLDSMGDDETLNLKEFLELVDEAEKQAFAKAYFITKEDEDLEIMRSLYGEELIQNLRETQMRQDDLKDKMNEELGTEFDYEYLVLRQSRTDLEANEASRKAYDKAIGRRFNKDNQYPSARKFKEVATDEGNGVYSLRLDDDVEVILDGDKYKLRVTGTRRIHNQWDGFDTPTDGMTREGLIERYETMKAEFEEEYPDLFEDDINRGEDPLVKTKATAKKQGATDKQIAKDIEKAEADTDKFAGTDITDEGVDARFIGKVGKADTQEALGRLTDEQLDRVDNLIDSHDYDGDTLAIHIPTKPLVENGRIKVSKKTEALDLRSKGEAKLAIAFARKQRRLKFKELETSVSRVELTIKSRRARSVKRDTKVDTTTTTGSLKKVLRDYDNKTFAELMGDNPNQRVYERSVEEILGHSKIRTEDIKAVDDMLRSITRARAIGYVEMAIDGIHVVIPNKYRNIMEKVIEDEGLIKNDSINLEELSDKLIDRLAMVDKDARNVADVRINRLLMEQLDTDGIGMRKNVVIGKAEAAEELHLANKEMIIRAVAKDKSLKQIRDDGTTKDNRNAREVMVDNLASALEDEGYLLEKILEDLGIEEGSDGNLAENGVGVQILDKFEEKYLDGLTVEDLGNGVEGISTAEAIGRGIVDIFRESEGHTRARINDTMTMDQEGNLVMRYQLGSILRKNYASPQTTARVVELLEDFTGHARANHFLKFDPETGNLKEMNDQEMKDIENWINSDEKDKVMSPLDKYGTGTRLIPKRSYVSPREELPGLEKIQERAMEDLIKLPPVYFATVHDSITVSNLGVMGDPTADGLNVDWDQKDIRGLTFGFATLAAIPGGFKDAMNRATEVMFPNAKGLVDRARLEARDEMMKDGLSEKDIDSMSEVEFEKRTAQMLMEGRVGLMKAPSRDSVHKQWEKHFGVTKLEGENLEIANRNYEQRLAAVTEINERGVDYMDANGSGPNIIQMHQNVAKAMAEDRNLLDSHEKWASDKAPDLYLEVQNHITDVVDAGELEGDPVGMWWVENVFNTKVTKEDLGEARPDSIRGLMKGPVMTVPYNAGKGALKGQVMEFFKKAKSDETLASELGIKDWTETQMEEHAEWLAGRMLSSGAVGGLNGARGWVREALDIPDPTKLLKVLFSSSATKVNYPGGTLDLTTATQGDLEKAALALSGRGTTGSSMTSFAVALTVLRTEAVKQKFSGRYTAAQIDKMVDDQLMPMIMASGKDGKEKMAALAAARASGLEQGARAQGLNAMFRTGFRLHEEDFNDVRTRMLHHNDSPTTVFRGDKEVTLLDSDVHPVTRLNQRVALFGDWVRTYEGRIMTPGEFMNVQASSYSRIRDRTEHQPGMYEIDTDYIIDSSLSEEDIGKQVKQRVLLDTALRLSKTFEPPTIGGRKYQDPSMDEFLEYSLVKDASNKKRFETIQTQLKEYGNEAEIEARINATDPDDTGVIADLREKLAFVKAYRSLAFAPIVEKQGDELKGLDAAIYEEGGYQSPSNILGGPEGSMPEVNRYGYGETVGIPKFRQLALERNKVVKRLRETQERSLDGIRRGGILRRNVFTLEEKAHISTKDRSAIPKLEPGKDYELEAQNPENTRTISLQEKTTLLANELDSFQGRYNIEDEDLVGMYNRLVGKKYKGDMKIEDTDRYHLLYILKKRNEWRVRRNRALADVKNQTNLEDMENKVLELHKRFNDQWNREAAQWSHDALTRETSVGDLNDSSGLMLRGGDTPEEAIRNINEKVDLENARVAWLFPDAAQSGQVISNTGNRGRPGTRAETGQTARIIQTNDSTYLILSHSEWEFGVKALYRERHPGKGEVSVDEYKKFIEEEMQKSPASPEEFNRAVAKVLTKDVEDLSDSAMGQIDILLHLDRGNIDPRLLDSSVDNTIGSIDSIAGHDVVNAVREANGVDPWAVSTYINVWGESTSLVNKVRGGARVALTFSDKVSSLMSPENKKTTDAMELAKIINATRMPVNMSRATALGSKNDSSGMTKTIDEFRDEAAFEAAALIKLVGDKKLKVTPETNMKKVKYPGSKEKTSPAFVNWNSNEKGYNVQDIDTELARVELEDILEGVQDREITIENVNATKVINEILTSNTKESKLVLQMFSAGVTRESQYEVVHPTKIDVGERSSKEKETLTEAHNEMRTSVMARVKVLNQIRRKAKLAASEELFREVVEDLINSDPNSQVNIISPDTILQKLQDQNKNWWPIGLAQDMAHKIYHEKVRLNSIPDPKDLTNVSNEVDAVRADLDKDNFNLGQKIQDAEEGNVTLTAERFDEVHQANLQAIRKDIQQKKYSYGPGRHQDPNRADLTVKDEEGNIKEALVEALAKGNAVDRFTRDVFADEVGARGDYVKNAESRELSDAENNRGPLFNSDQEMETLKEDLLVLKKQIVGEGETIITNEIQLYDPDNAMQGKTDIMVLTKDKKRIRIYDVKTMTKLDLEVKVDKEAEFTKREQYRYQMSAYAMMARKNLGVEVEAIAVLPIVTRDGLKVAQPIEMDKLTTLVSERLNKEINVDAPVTTRDAPKIYQGWDKPVSNKYGLFFSTAEGMLQRMDDPIKGPAADNGINLSSRNIYEVKVDKELEFPDGSNDFIGRAEDVTVIGKVEAGELEAIVEDPNRQFIFSTRDDLAEGTRVTAEDKGGQKGTIESLNREQKRNVINTAKQIEEIKRDKRRNKGMDYWGKEDVFATRSTPKKRINNIVNVLSTPDEAGRTFLSKSEAKLLRQILSTWEGTDLLHDVIFKVENRSNGDYSGRFTGKYDPEAKDFIRSINLVADMVKDADGVDLSAIDIVMHEIGHVAEHKLWSGPKSEDYHLTLAAFRDESSREGVMTLLNALHKNNPDRAQQMYKHIYGRGEDNIEEGLSELFAQLFSFSIISKSMDSLNWQKLTATSGRADGVNTVNEMFAAEAHNNLLEVSAILTKIRDNDGPLSQVLRMIDRNYLHRPLRSSEVSGRFTKEITRNSPVDVGPKERIEIELGEIREELEKRIGENRRNNLERRKTELEAQLENVSDRPLEVNMSSNDVERIIQDNTDPDSGLVDLSDLPFNERNTVHQHVLTNAVFDYNGAPIDLVFEDSVGSMAPQTKTSKLKKLLANVSSPFSGRGAIEYSDFDVLRFFGAMGDEQNLYIGANYGNAQGMPTLQQMSISHNGKWDTLIESLAGHIEERSDRFKTIEELKDYMEQLSEYYMADSAGRNAILESMDEKDRLFTLEFMGRFDDLYRKLLEDMEVSGKISPAQRQSMLEGRSLPIRMREEFYTGGRETATRAFETKYAEEMLGKDTIDPDILTMAAGVNGKDTMLIPNPARDRATDAEVSKAWDDLDDETRANLTKGYAEQNVRLKSFEANSVEDFKSIFSWAHAQANIGALRKSVFSEPIRARYEMAITNPDSVNNKGFALVTKEYRAKHPNLYGNSRNTAGSPEDQIEMMSGSGWQTFKTMNLIGSSAFMFTGDRYLSSKDIWNTPALREHIETNLGSISAGMQKGVGWDAYSTRTMQEFTGIKGFGYMQMLRAADRMLSKKQRVRVRNSEGIMEEVEITDAQRKQIKTALHLAERRYEYAGRNMRGISDHKSKLVNWIHDAGVKAVMIVNGPNFLPASLLVELPMGFARRLARNTLTNSDENLLAGLLDGMSEKKRRENLKNLAITAHYHRTGGLSSAQYATADSEGVAKLWDIIRGKSMLDDKGRLTGKALNLATMGFGKSQLGMRAMEILPAQQRLQGDFPRLRKLRDIVNERRGDWKGLSDRAAKKEFRKAVRDAGFGSLRYEGVDEYFRLGMLEDGVIEQMETWIDPQMLIEDVIDLDPMIQDTMRTADKDGYAKKEQTLRIIQNYLHNAATKTNLEMRVSSAPVAVEDKLTAIMSRLTSYTTMFYQQVFRRNLHTAAPAAIAGMFMGYMMMEQLYAKLMDLASGRSWEEIQKEYTEDPVGSLISAAGRLPVMGFSSFMFSGIIDQMRKYLGSFEGLPIGYRDLRGGGGSPFGVSGLETSLNTMYRGISGLISIPTDLLMGKDVNSSRYFTTSKAIPMPLRPVIAMAMGLAMGEQQMNRRGGRGNSMYNNGASLLGAAGMMDAQHVPETSPQFQRARRDSENSRRQAFANELRGKPQRTPKPPQTQPPAPSRTAGGAIAMPAGMDQKKDFIEVPDTPDLTSP